MDFLSKLVLAVAILGTASLAAAEDPPRDLTPIGGKWYVQSGVKPVYFYLDAGRYVDLFSYHIQDSNKDGIDNVRLSHDSRSLIIQSQGYPNHPTASFPNSGNPNSIRVQNFHFRLPLEPKVAPRITRVPMGPIGMALNGVVFFNPFEAGGMNAVEGYSEVWLDSCCGHPQQTGVYHYHKYPSCVKSPFPDDGKQHSPVIGFAWDGFPIYGPYQDAGVMARDLKGTVALDVCNGHSDKQRGYHYHVTPGRFPYVIGGYAGTPDPANGRGLGRGEAGAITNNASGVSRLEQVITAVKPGTASRGKKHTIQIELTPANSRFGVPSGKPAWAQIGPFEATKIERSANILKIEIDIPADSAVGVWLDCHVEFEGAGRGGTKVFKRNDAFRVVE
ncbi:MAG: YHYH protein [Planctomycetes bacterium]|nr:YHYH protein [Planctomycetota bacterium]